MNLEVVVWTSNVPHRLLYVDIWSPMGDSVWEGEEPLRKWALSASWLQIHCDQPAFHHATLSPWDPITSQSKSSPLKSLLVRCFFMATRNVTNTLALFTLSIWVSKWYHAVPKSQEKQWYTQTTGLPLAPSSLSDGSFNLIFLGLFSPPSSAMTSMAGLFSVSLCSILRRTQEVYPLPGSWSEDFMNSQLWEATHQPTTSPTSQQACFLQGDARLALWNRSMNSLSGRPNLGAYPNHMPLYREAPKELVIKKLLAHLNLNFFLWFQPELSVLSTSVGDVCQLEVKKP